MLVQIDQNAGEPVFDQIAVQVATQVADGRLVRGDRLPAARELAGALGVNVHTVLHAYQRLRDEGVVELRRGRGAVVTGSAGTDRLHRALAVAIAEARAAGIGRSSLIALIQKEFGS